jgi:hypothetical protein
LQGVQLVGTCFGRSTGLSFKECDQSIMQLPFSCHF